MTKTYYEAHVTMVGSPQTVRPLVENLLWKFSAIDGDINLGDGIKCYATKHFNSRLNEQDVVNILIETANKLENSGATVVRRKVERVFFDDRSSLVKPCDGACPECHLDDLVTEHKQ